MRNLTALLVVLSAAVVGGCNALLDIHDHDVVPAAGGEPDAGAGGSGASAGHGGTGAGSAGKAGSGPSFAGSGGSVAGSAGSGATGGDAGSATLGGSAGSLGAMGGGAGLGGGPACGNATLEGAEACDDGNTKAGDGCSATCEFEAGFLCDDAGCAPICGDGLVVGAEAKAGGCDDNNDVDGDGCTGCKVDVQYVCSGAPSDCQKTCGNGRLEGAESCDDGNAAPDDGCYACKIEGGYTCDVAQDPSSCSDINECSTGDNDCDTNATCHNVAGGYTCACKQGFDGDGVTCHDLNECQGQGDGNDCSPNANCTNKPGSFSCVCKGGYLGDGVTCDDADECDGEGSGNNCSPNAGCTNTPGSFSCNCEPGYTGNGVNCTQNSCYELASNCGPSQNESCCSTAMAVTGGDFYRNYDGYYNNDTSYPASVTGFQMDRFEVTVGRFRKFVAAWNAGWRPQAGDGKHRHLNGGYGLVDASITTSTAYEPGWNLAWEGDFDPSDDALECDYPYYTWSPYDDDPTTETKPINCVSWAGSYAFCIWDGGFLPSETEWNYAAVGGDDQRLFPWGDSSLTNAYANYGLYSYGPNPVGSESVTGDGRWGQADLAGNVAEWNLDWQNTTPEYCDDCVYLGSSLFRGQRGGDYRDDDDGLYPASKGLANPDAWSTYGIRCVRP